MTKKALTLGGGSIKGGWQAGVIQGLTAQGFMPDIVTGISVGALNTAFLASEHPADQDLAEWKEVGEELAAFWIEHVTGPEIIFKKRHWYELIYRGVFKKWQGLVNTEPLDTFVRHYFHDGSSFAAPCIQALVGTVSLRTGELVYVSSAEEDFIDAVLASTAEPLTMPLRRLRGEWCADGGVRDITPLAEAIRQGADEIIAVVCQPDGIGIAEDDWGDAFKMVEREIDIVESEILKNDLRFCNSVNQMVAAGIAPDKRPVSVRVIRPAAPLPIDIRHFSTKDMKEMVAWGNEAAHVIAA